MAPGAPGPIGSGAHINPNGATNEENLRGDERDGRAIAEFMKREGQFLLPMVELVEHTELAIDEVI